MPTIVTLQLAPPPSGFSDLPTALQGASVVDIPAPPENQMMSYLIVSSLLSKAANLIVIWTRNAVQVRTTYSAIIVVWHFTNLSHLAFLLNNQKINYIANKC